MRAAMQIVPRLALTAALATINAAADFGAAQAQASMSFLRCTDGRSTEVYQVDLASRTVDGNPSGEMPAVFLELPSWK
jgi:hypothetical protein